MPLRLASTVWAWNRNIHPALRPVHVLASAVRTLAVRASIGPHRWTIRALLLAALVLAAAQLDPSFEGGKELSIGGDIRRELRAWQQFGGLTSILVAGLIIARLDQRWRRIIPQLALAAGLAFAIGQPIKMLLGRTRPELGDHAHFLWPVGQWPVLHSQGPRLQHSWQFWLDGASQLWSMPSSHTASAMALAATLIAFYPKLRSLLLALVLVVGFGRVATGAHYPSDVVVGAAVGLLAAILAHRITHKPARSAVTIA